jgi:hypothetical protein
MKKFVSENWYKLMIGSSLLMASFGFMVHSVSPAMADNNNQKLNVNSNYRLVPTNADGSINVKLSDDQLDKIIPKNEDGSINVKMAPNAVMDINLKQIANLPAGFVKIPSSGEAALPVMLPSNNTGALQGGTGFKFY